MEKLSRVDKAGSVERVMTTTETALEFCLDYAETSRSLVTKKARNKVGNIIELSSHAKFDADRFCWHVQAFDDRKRRLKDSKDKQLAHEGLTTRTLEN